MDRLANRYRRRIIGISSLGLQDRSDRPTRTPLLFVEFVILRFQGLSTWPRIIIADG